VAFLPDFPIYPRFYGFWVIASLFKTGLDAPRNLSQGRKRALPRKI
jgi:hypothetical protein